MSTAAVITNPRDGAVLAVPAGEALNLVFEVENDNPLDVVGFYFAIADLPAAWWAGPTSANPLQIVAGGKDVLTLTLKPAAGAQPANYPFTVHIQAVNDAVAPEARSLTLCVEEGDATPAPVVPEVAATPAAVPREPVAVVVEPPASAEPTPVEPAVPAGPVEEPPRVIETAPPVEPVPPPPPSQPVAPPPSQPASPPPGQQVAPSPPRQPAAPSPTQPAAPPAAQEPVSVPRPAPKREKSAPKPAEPAPVETVSLPREEPVAVEVRQQVAPLPEADRQVINPEDRRILHMLPGERMLLRFKFHNTQNYPCNYILDEDRMATLPEGWLDRTQAQVNITPNAEGEVFCLVTPPENARPGEYQFALFIGAQHAANPEERYYTLLIEATPAVKIAAKEPQKQAGPFGHEATFPLVVSNAGNSETAFRVAVREPRAPADDDEEAQMPRELYETPNWTYGIDREVENLKAPAQGRELKPVDIRLRVKRRGPWWWGFQESHTATVAAVPVTDPTNGGKDENTAQVNLKRWRLLPFPYIFLIPIILAFMIAGSQAWDLRVTNGLQEPGKNGYFVFGAVPMSADVAGAVPISAHVAWNAIPLMPQQIVFGGKEKTLTVTHRVTHTDERVGGDKYFKNTECTVRNSTITINFIPVRTNGALTVLADDQIQPPELDEAVVGQEKVKVPRATYTLKVTTEEGKYTQLQFRNTDTTGSRIKIIVFQQPESSKFEIRDIAERTPESGKTALPFKIRAQEVGADGELVFVTTDGKQQIVRIRLGSK